MISDPVRTSRITHGFADPEVAVYSVAATDRTLLQDLQRLIEPATRGDPMSPLLWTCKSTRNLADALVDLGHDLSHQTVGRLLVDLGYSLQANRKTEEGKDHPDRDAQFEHINRKVRSFQRRGQPVVSVDTKKKEIVGNYQQFRPGMGTARVGRAGSSRGTSRTRNWARWRRTGFTT